MEVSELPYAVFLDEIHAIRIPFPKALGLSGLCVRPRDKSDADPDSLCGFPIARHFDHRSCDPRFKDIDPLAIHAPVYAGSS